MRWKKRKYWCHQKHTSSLSRLPSELVTLILEALPVEKIKTLCSELGIYCGGETWRNALVTGYDLYNYATKLREVQPGRQLNWLAILLFFDSGLDRVGQPLRGIDLKEDPTLFAKLIRESVSELDVFYFLVLGTASHEEVGLISEDTLFKLITAFPDISNETLDRLELLRGRFCVDLNGLVGEPDVDPFGGPINATSEFLAISELTHKYNSSHDPAIRKRTFLYIKDMILEVVAKFQQDDPSLPPSYHSEHSHWIRLGEVPGTGAFTGVIHNNFLSSDYISDEGIVTVGEIFEEIFLEMGL